MAEEVFILMKDCEGRKLPGKISSAMGKVFSNFGNAVPHQVLRGELLVLLKGKPPPSQKEGRPAPNYQVKNDSSIFVFCAPDDVSPLIDPCEASLLEGISSLSSRHALFVGGTRIEWALKLKAGANVYVSIPSGLSVPTWAATVIRYIGNVEGLPGTQFGVEIMDTAFRDQGACDGTFGETRYFICEDNNGHFVSLDRINSEPIKREYPAPAYGKSYAAAAGADSSHGTPASNTRSKKQSAAQESSTDAPHCQFRMNERVKVYDKKGKEVYGKVIWCRNYETMAKSEYTCIVAVGIETEAKVFMADFEGAVQVPGKIIMRSVLKHHLLIMPETLVMSAEKPNKKPDVEGSLIDLSSPTSLVKTFGNTKNKLKEDELQVLEEAKQRMQNKDAERRCTQDPSSSRQSRTNPQPTTRSEHSYESIPGAGNGRGMKGEAEQHAQLHTAPGGKVDRHHQLLQSNPHTSSPEQTRTTTNPGARSATVYNDPTCSDQYFDSVTDLDYSQSNNQQSSNQRVQQNFYSQRRYTKQNSNQLNLSSSSQPPVHSSQRQPSQRFNVWWPQQSATNEQPSQLPPRQFSTDVWPSQQQFGTNERPFQQPSTANVGTSNPYNLSVGSTVQISTADPTDPPHYGVIRWIGAIAGANGQVAGIELESYLEGCTDGTVKSTGEKFFECSFGRGLYFPLASLVPDRRFDSLDNPVNAPMEEEVDQFIHDTAEQMRLYTGNVKGIQGHQNSCYLDSTIFGLFALSDIFDTMFLEPNQSITSSMSRTTVCQLLWKGIVNPLRKNGVVRYESVMKIRNALAQLGKIEGISEKEKDPEEFLNMLFKHVLHTKPFISIKRPFGVENEFFVQLFVEQDPNNKLSTVERLVNKMFKEQEISFTKVPSKLLILLPRFGQEFRPFQKVVPELKINIKELMDGFKIERGAHKTTSAAEADVYNPVSELGLLSVICIETSHYVCFTRDPRDETERKWIFFDSMADRHYDTFNIPRVTDCTRELNEWVYSGDRTRLMSTQPRQLPELVRRFTQDIYMCVYIQPDVAMFGDTDEEEEDKGAAYSQQFGPFTPVAKEKLLEYEKNKLQQRLKEVQQRVEELTHEKAQCIELADQQKRQLAQCIEQADQQKYQLMQQMQREIERQRRENENQLANKEERIKQLELDLQQKVDSAPESSVSRFTKVQIPRQDQDSWNVQRREVVIQQELGHGAWGSVYKGVFRGRQVAVKKAHQQILYETTIDQLIREIRIMAHVQHPNLVRLIAAVVDEGVERRTESPLVILELMETDLRLASRKHDFPKVTLLSIFRDVAYALHYLHEHQEPIIHRDVSAPNILLQRIYQDIWRAKLSDFGSANLAKHCKTAGPGAIVYSAPETFPNIDPPPKQTTKIDVYSYGYMLVESIAKEMPSHDKRDTMLSTIKEVWAPMYYLIIACTNKEPERRLTMSQVLERLHSLSNE